MTPDKSVIQTTAEAHKANLEAAVFASDRFMRLTTDMSEPEIAAYLKGARDFYGFATFHILHRGNCKFESAHE